MTLISNLNLKGGLGVGDWPCLLRAIHWFPPSTANRIDGASVVFNFWSSFPWSGHPTSASVTILEWTSDSPKTLQPSLDGIVDIMLYFYKSLFRNATCMVQCFQEKLKETFYFWSVTDHKWRSHCCYCSFCLMLLSKAACDPAAVAEEVQDGMTL